jgi:hypothetical protein
MTLSLSSMKSIKLRMATASLLSSIRREHSETSSLLDSSSAFFKNPFAKEPEISFYTFFFSYSNLLRTDQQRIRLMSELQGLLYGETRYKEEDLRYLYEAESERYDETYARSLGFFSSIKLTTALQATAAFVSGKYPKISSI